MMYYPYILLLDLISYHFVEFFLCSKGILVCGFFLMSISFGTSVIPFSLEEIDSTYID